MTDVMRTTDPVALIGARDMVHQAAQIFFATGEALADKAPDHSHTNLLWRADHRDFVGRPLVGGHRITLDPVDLKVSVLGADGATVDSWSMVGAPMADSLGRIAKVLTGAGVSMPADGLPSPTYDLPEHPVAKGAPFEAPAADAVRALVDWYALAGATLQAVADQHAGASEVRCWPHHFDIATLIAVDADAHEEHARSVGVGLSPGDGGIAQPYIYVTPWPAPKPDGLPPLSAGAQWHTSGWVGAVVLAERIVEEAPEKRVAFVGEAVAEAIAAGLKIVGAG